MYRAKVPLCVARRLTHILPHMGISAKLASIEGTQIFQQAIKSSFMFVLYAFIARLKSGFSAQLASLQA